VIAEQIGVADVGLQHAHRPVQGRLEPIGSTRSFGRSSGFKAARSIRPVGKRLRVVNLSPFQAAPEVHPAWWKVAALQDLLESDAGRIETVEIIRSLVDQVVFRPARGTEGIEVDLVGDIAGMVHLAQNSNENSPFPGLFMMSSSVRFTERERNGGIIRSRAPPW
jgi:hypothetical protein